MLVSKKLAQKVWPSKEVNTFLNLKGAGKADGFYKRIKGKKISRTAAMAEIMKEMQKKSFQVTAHW